MVTPLSPRLIRFVVSVTLAVGVKVAVHVTPPSLDETLLIVPFATVRSALVRPLTASLKVIVNSEVSPAVSVVSASTIVAVGRTVSMA